MIEFFTRQSKSFPRGIHPADQKHLAEHAAIEVLPTPGRVDIPMLQHLGAPCEVQVKPRKAIALGDLVGLAEAFVSAPVHASVAGKAARPSVATLPNGRHVETLPIKAGEQILEGQALYSDHFGGSWALESADDHDPVAIRSAVRKAGLVGMGGAAFPTHVKLTPRTEGEVDTLLVNGCECEPYLTADHRVMMEAAAAVLAGARLAARAVGAERVIIAIEDNKREAIERLADEASGTGVIVRSVPTKYPQGAERQLVLVTLGRTVPTGGLPLDVGVVVVNVGTAASIGRAVLRSGPLTHRVVTVTGSGIDDARNVLVPIGTSYGTLVDFAGGLRGNAERVVAGGPMMGFCVSSLDSPITKGTSGITVLTSDDLEETERTACVRCARCVDVCPLGLVPTRIALAARHADWELARRHHIRACMECGCCAWACPSGIPLVQLIRLGKAEMPS